MARSVRAVAASILLLSGCASTPLTGYIGRNDHPYRLQIYGSFDKVVSCAMLVLKQKRWAVISEVDPSIYERDDRYDNGDYQNLLIMTQLRGSAHLNVFIHSSGKISDVEIRYESQAPFVSVRNDKVVEDVLNGIQDEVIK